ncbi:MAG: hypothetical protein GY796_05310 [Chloroflexi bacterium]|nr:hypothetical protein [Chloroflexota bacterium]
MSTWLYSLLNETLPSLHGQNPELPIELDEVIYQATALGLDFTPDGKLG